MSIVNILLALVMSIGVANYNFKGTPTMTVVDTTAETTTEIVSPDWVIQTPSSDEKFTVNKGIRFYEYEVPNIDYEKQETETSLNTGLHVGTGTFGFNADEINNKNIQIYNGVSDEIMFSVIPPTIEMLEYPATLNLEKVNLFTYSPFYFNATTFKATADGDFTVYLYDRDKQIIGVIKPEDGEVILDTENLEDYYVLILNNSYKDSISVKLELSVAE